ncbi:MAG TPA: GNAT family N-acetyltransferase [Piscinibacter sp.]|jgi:ribosomal protein S18 acetylase RimI-like enzyme|nr:GNAT family N-acetyltransferase [Piscinibacter sp.]
MPIEIRQARVTDLDAVARLFDDYRRFYHAASNLALATAFIGERLRGQDSVILMARDGDGVALGFTQLFPSFSSVGCTRIFVLNDLYVAESCRGRGVGRALLAAARSRAQEVGAARLVLETAVDNRAAQVLYESFGFEREAGFLAYALSVA